MNGPEFLAGRWRETAAQLKRYAAREQAEVLEACAEQLEAWWREHELEALTLERAAEESGYTVSALEKQLQAGKLVNVGGPGSRRVRRCDLPRKGGRAPLKAREEMIAGALERAVQR